MKLILLFHLATILSFSCLSQVSHTSTHLYKQEPLISLSVKNQPLREVLNSIAEQSDYHFNYVVEDIGQIKYVTINVKSVKIKTLLGLLEKKHPIKFYYIGNIVGVVLVK